MQLFEFYFISHFIFGQTTFTKTKTETVLVYSFDIFGLNNYPDYSNSPNFYCWQFWISRRSSIFEQNRNVSFVTIFPNKKTAIFFKTFSLKKLYVTYTSTRLSYIYELVFFRKNGTSSLPVPCPSYEENRTINSELVG